MDIYELLNNEKIGTYNNCEIIEIVLKEKDNYWNYFTHIYFSSKSSNVLERKYLTDSLKTIRPGIKLAICKRIIQTDKVVEIIKKALKDQIWDCDSDQADLDDVHLTDPHFVPETDPTGSFTTNLTCSPVEFSLYGSNFSGGYYLVDLFSTKKALKNILTEEDILNIQKEIKSAGLIYDLYALRDRIGNIVCRIDVEVMEHNIKKISPERGISGEIRLNENYENRIIECNYLLLQKNDNMLMNHKIERFTLSSETPVYLYNIEPNRYLNNIIISDVNSNVIYYASLRDYSFGSDYFSVISSPQFGLQTAKRELKINENKVKVDIVNIQGLGEVTIPTDVYEIEKRNQVWKDRYVAEHSFFTSFRYGEHEKAIQTIINIINDKELMWDLREIWLVDPYLSADDILNTVVYSEKKGIKIRGFTSLGKLQKNSITKLENETKMSNFDFVKEIFRKRLDESIPREVDIHIEFRTAYNSKDSDFHDRYLICLYGLNKCRAWSLGTSINALGKSHHIIQIVESPMEVYKVVNEMWEKANGIEHLIYKNE